MKLKFLSLLMILLLFVQLFPQTILAFKNDYEHSSIISPCSCGDTNDPACQKEHKKHANSNSTFWSEENINILNKEQKAKLYKLQKKITNGKILTDEEKIEMLELKDVVAKHKLGEKDFNDFKRLMEKLKANENLTESECKTLKYYLEKII